MDLNTISEQLPPGVSLTYTKNEFRPGIPDLELYVDRWGEAFSVSEADAPIVVTMIGRLLAIQGGDRLPIKFEPLDAAGGAA